MSAEPLVPDAPTRERISRKCRTTGLSALLLAILAVVAPMGLLVAEPLAVPVAFGATDPVEALVTNVTLIEPARPGQRGSRPVWEVAVRWNPVHSGTTGAGTTARGRQVTDDPSRVGTSVSVVDLGDGRVSFLTRNDAWALVLLAIGVAIGSGVGSLWCRRRKRRWAGLIPRTTEEMPINVTVLHCHLGPSRRSEKRGWVVRYDLKDNSGPGGTLLLERHDERALLQDDNLQIWAAGADNRGPFLVRRPADDTWWLGGGPDPVPAFSPPARG